MKKSLTQCFIVILPFDSVGSLPNRQPVCRTAVLMEIIAARRGKYFQHFALFPLFPWPHEAPRGRRHRTRFFARNGFCAGKSPRFPFWPSGRSSKIFYRILRRPPKTVRSSGPSGRTCGVPSSSLINRRPGQSPPKGPASASAVFRNGRRNRRTRLWRILRRSCWSTGERPVSVKTRRPSFRRRQLRNRNRTVSASCEPQIPMQKTCRKKT